MFYVIGLGLGDAKDITVKGLEIIKKCDRVYLENYTSILSVGVEALEEFYGRKLILADRDMVELGIDEILEGATHNDIALLVVGDPFGATTHSDLAIRAKQKGIQIRIVHNASILNAVGCTGLQLYNFGETVSIPFWTEHWKPDSFMDKIIGNFVRNLHTLCLLDIKIKEQTTESLVKKKKEYEPSRFMTVNTAAQQIIQCLHIKKLTKEPFALTEDSLCVGVARVGSDTQKIIACSLKEMQEMNLGPPLHSLIIPGTKFHPLEEVFMYEFQKLTKLMN